MKIYHCLKTALYRRLSVAVALSIFACAQHVARADSSFLPALEFYHYPNYTIPLETSTSGISPKKYLEFLLSDERTLGEKAALVSALASYVEFLEFDDNPRNDKDDHFREYADLFRKKVLERFHQKDIRDAQIPPEYRLLDALMDDFGTFRPNIARYNALAQEMPTSLTAQTIRVIAFGYDVLYNSRWDKVAEYEEVYQDPYLSQWQTYQADIAPQVYGLIEGWLFYIYSLRATEIPAYKAEFDERFKDQFSYVEAAPVEEEATVETAVETEKLCLVEHRGELKIYCQAAFTDLEGYIGVALTPKGEYYYHWINLFELRFMVKTNDGRLPDGYFQYDSQDEHANNVLFLPEFEMSYGEWEKALHVFRPSRMTVYIQQWDDENYTIVGCIYLDTKDKDSLNFLFHGKVSPQPNEVISISVYVPSDYENTEGQLTINNDTIALPFAFCTWTRWALKVFFVDRILEHDRHLEHGISFELEPKNGKIPTGTFSYKENGIDRDCFPAFFEQGETEKPVEATITIKKHGKEEYKIEYTFKLSDNRILKGYYRGQISYR